MTHEQSPTEPTHTPTLSAADRLRETIRSKTRKFEGAIAISALMLGAVACSGEVDSTPTPSETAVETATTSPEAEATPEPLILEPYVLIEDKVADTLDENWNDDDMADTWAQAFIPNLQLTIDWMIENPTVMDSVDLSPVALPA